MSLYCEISLLWSREWSGRWTVRTDCAIILYRTQRNRTSKAFGDFLEDWGRFFTSHLWSLFEKYLIYETFHELTLPFSSIDILTYRFGVERVLGDPYRCQEYRGVSSLRLCSQNCFFISDSPHAVSLIGVISLTILGDTNEVIGSLSVYDFL